MRKVIDGYAKFRELQESKYDLPYDDRALVNKLPDSLDKLIAEGTDVEHQMMIALANDLGYDVKIIESLILSIRRWLNDIKLHQNRASADLGNDENGFKILRNS